MMERIVCKTSNNENPRGKQKVFVASDNQYLVWDILSTADCAVFYYDDDYRYEEASLDDLQHVQLFVLPVTRKQLKDRESALYTQYRFAQEHNIPVLPVAMERGLEDSFNENFGQLQLLYYAPRETAEHNDYIGKLRSFLGQVLFSSKFVAEIKESFSTNIFLSYRKKDRDYAVSLMKLLHQDEQLYDMGIWYDEFLIPGEDFNDGIDNALKNSDGVVLCVTPNILQPHNYILVEEYPAAIRYGKAVLPVEMKTTDPDKLQKHYGNLPLCMQPENAEAIAQALKAMLRDKLQEQSVEDPTKLYRLGMAYMQGIGVERNHELGIQLLSRAYYAGEENAIKVLADAYKTGSDTTKSILGYWRSVKGDTAKLAQYTQLPDLPELSDLLIKCDHKGFQLSQLHEAFYRKGWDKTARAALIYLREYYETCINSFAENALSQWEQDDSDHVQYWRMRIYRHVAAMVYQYNQTVSALQEKYDISEGNHTKYPFDLQFWYEEVNRIALERVARDRNEFTLENLARSYVDLSNKCYPQDYRKKCDACVQAMELLLEINRNRIENNCREMYSVTDVIPYFGMIAYNDNALIEKYMLQLENLTEAFGTRRALEDMAHIYQDVGEYTRDQRWQEKAKQLYIWLHKTFDNTDYSYWKRNAKEHNKLYPPTESADRKYVKEAKRTVKRFQKAFKPEDVEKDFNNVLRAYDAVCRQELMEQINAIKEEREMYQFFSKCAKGYFDNWMRDEQCKKDLVKFYLLCCYLVDEKKHHPVCSLAFEGFESIARETKCPEVLVKKREAYISIRGKNNAQFDIKNVNRDIRKMRTAIFRKRLKRLITRKKE